MYNFLTLKRVRFLAGAAIVLSILVGIWINYVFYGGAQAVSFAFMV